MQQRNSSISTGIAGGYTGGERWGVPEPTPDTAYLPYGAAYHHQHPAQRMSPSPQMGGAQQPYYGSSSSLHSSSSTSTTTTTATTATSSSSFFSSSASSSSSYPQQQGYSSSPMLPHSSANSSSFHHASSSSPSLPSSFNVPTSSYRSTSGGGGHTSAVSAGCSLPAQTHSSSSSLYPAAVPSSQPHSTFTDAPLSLPTYMGSTWGQQESDRAYLTYHQQQKQQNLFQQKQQQLQNYQQHNRLQPPPQPQRPQQVPDLHGPFTTRGDAFKRLALCASLLDGPLPAFNADEWETASQTRCTAINDKIETATKSLVSLLQGQMGGGEESKEHTILILRLQCADLQQQVVGERERDSRLLATSPSLHAPLTQQQSPSPFVEKRNYSSHYSRPSNVPSPSPSSSPSPYPYHSSPSQAFGQPTVNAMNGSPHQSGPSATVPPRTISPSQLPPHYPSPLPSSASAHRGPPYH